MNTTSPTLLNTFWHKVTQDTLYKASKWSKQAIFRTHWSDYSLNCYSNSSILSIIFSNICTGSSPYFLRTFNPLLMVSNLSTQHPAFKPLDWSQKGSKPSSIHCTFSFQITIFGLKNSEFCGLCFGYVFSRFYKVLGSGLSIELIPL